MRCPGQSVADRNPILDFDARATEWTCALRKRGELWVKSKKRIDRYLGLEPKTDTSLEIIFQPGRPSLALEVEFILCFYGDKISEIILLEV